MQNISFIGNQGSCLRTHTSSWVFQTSVIQTLDLNFLGGPCLFIEYDHKLMIGTSQIWGYWESESRLCGRSFCVNTGEAVAVHFKEMRDVTENPSGLPRCNRDTRDVLQAWQARSFLKQYPDSVVIKEEATRCQSWGLNRSP